VLELACGPGGVGIAAAALVGPAGKVVLSDVAEAMTAIAAARAAGIGLGNVSTMTLDLDHLDQPDQAYDVVLCREGLMFAFDPAHAVAEIRRVLRPGGRVAVDLEDPERLGRLLAETGLADVVVEEVPVPLHDATFDAWLTRTSALAGPLAKRLALLGDPARRELRARLEAAVRPHPDAGRARVPGGQPGRGRAPRLAQGGASPR
jgi:ubiquinone/menaquinone biosynthesis C-methylase UbiE